MPGLDPAVLDTINPEQALGRINNDLKTDFILSPHYAAVFAHVGGDLWDQVSTALRSGRFDPDLPITIEVPKPNGLTRPGSILKPADRLVYQVLTDVIAPVADAQIDRSRAFSNILLNPDPEHRMFESSHISWRQMQDALTRYGRDEAWSHAIRADVANFFERLYQHVLINLLTSSGCATGAVNLLEQLLLSWMEKDSHGILQGMFPSDFFGNFYLVGLDSELEVQGVPSARNVDDLYIFYQSESDARKGLVQLCGSLRQEGLHLNDRKSSILEAQQLVYEETLLDRMFEEARAEAEAHAPVEEAYGFQSTWLPDDEEDLEEKIQLRAVEALYEQVGDANAPTDRIERFCLPLLASAESEVAVERALEGVLERPHLAKVYCSYLVRIALQDRDLVTRLEQILLEGEFSYDWQLMWPIAALLQVDAVTDRTVTHAIRLLRMHECSVAMRALCALLIGKHGRPGQ
jgi:hypothetical protein